MTQNLSSTIHNPPTPNKDLRECHQSSLVPSSLLFRVERPRRGNHVQPLRFITLDITLELRYTQIEKDSWSRVIVTNPLHTTNFTD